MRAEILQGIVVAPGTRDPLAAAYVLRGVDWQRTKEFRMPVFDGEDLYELRARLDVPGETVAVDAGNFDAAKISIHLFQREREVSGMKFFAWLANDAGGRLCCWRRRCRWEIFEWSWFPRCSRRRFAKLSKRDSLRTAR